MNQATRQALDQACAAVRADLAAEGVAWHQAWFVLSKGTGSRSCIIRYTELPGGPVLTTDRYPKAGDSVPRLPIDVPDAAGRPWNQLLLTLYTDGRHEVAFDYPGPRPDPDRDYTEREILAHMAECVWHDLVFDEWAEASLEATPDLIPFLYHREVPGGRLKDGDCNGLDQWLERLWKLRLEFGHGPWGRVKILFQRGSSFVRAEYQPPGPKVVEPPPLPPQVSSLDELFRRIVAAERRELDDTCRRMDEDSHVRVRWKRSRLAAYRDEEHNLIYVDRELRLTDGREWEEPAEDDVEDLFIEVFDRVDAGDDPTGLAVPGLTVEPGASPRFTLVVRNDPPGPADRRRK